MNSTLPPLPLEKGALLTSNTFFETWHTCSQASSYNFLHKRVATGDAPSLLFGSAVHKALQSRYTDCLNQPTSPSAEQLMENAAAAVFDEKPPMEGEELNYAFCCEVLRQYNRTYRQEPFELILKPDGKPCVEESFALPLFTYTEGGWNIPVLYRGLIDLAVRWDNLTTLIDHKTSKMFFGPARFVEEQKMANQLYGYAWAWETLFPDEKVGAIAINGITCKQPPKTKPRQGTMEQWWSGNMIREIVYLTLEPQWKSRWYQDSCEAVCRFLWQYRRGHMPQDGRFTKACAKFNGCQYASLCSLPQDQAEALLLNENVFTTRTASPIK